MEDARSRNDQRIRSSGYPPTHNYIRAKRTTREVESNAVTVVILIYDYSETSQQQVDCGSAALNLFSEYTGFKKHSWEER